MLQDRFGRRITYLRVSVTDRCDLRCLYCMAEQMEFLPRAQVLTLEEIEFIVAIFVELGIERVRITGGEPLVRRGILQLIERLGKLPLRELTLTTNATRLAPVAKALRQAGIKRINISLDTLKPERFRKITRVGDLKVVLGGIEAAQEAGFDRIKINSVILKGYNHDEVVDLTRFAVERGFDIAFIEEMPLGIVPRERAASYYSSDQILADLRAHFELIPTAEKTGGPARYFRIVGSDTKVGFISPHSHNFCNDCNRVRLTAEGRLLLCLGQEHAVDLKQLVRRYPGEVAPLKEAIQKAMWIKPRGHEFKLHEQPIILRHMNHTGG